MKRAVYCALISAVAGFAIAIYVASTPPLPITPLWLQSTIAYILCPPGILAGLTLTDPDAVSIWLLFGPLNALIYGFVGFILGRKFLALPVDSKWPSTGS